MWCKCCTFCRPVKMMKRKNLDTVAANEQNGPGLREFTRESSSDSTKIAYWVFATSVLKKPTMQHVSFFPQRIKRVYPLLMQNKNQLWEIHKGNKVWNKVLTG